jgi:zinc D-Ala-D-Ala carboxypeptidase
MNAYPDRPSAHFSWAEVQASVTAKARGIDNRVPEGLLTNVLNTAARMELARAELGGPLKVTSWYRCEALNHAIGGSKTSKHMEGLAVDFRPTTVGLKVAFEILARAEHIPFDQLIYETTKSGAAWIHIGFSRTVPRRQVLRATGAVLGGPMVYTRVYEG